MEFSVWTGECGGFSLVRLDDGRMLIAYYARADRSKSSSVTSSFPEPFLLMLAPVDANGWTR